MRRLIIPFSLLLVAWSIQAFGALDNPTPQLLAKRLTPTISPYWTVAAVKITASVNTGDAVEPNIKQRFEATVKPSSTLYVKDQGAAKAFAPYVPIVPTVTAESARTLYGIAQSAYSAGQWSTKFELENSVASLGMPRGMFSAPTVVRGGKEEARIQAILRPDVAQRFKRKLQAQIEKLKAKHEAEIRALEAAHAKDVDQVRAQNTAEVHEIKREQERALVQIKSGYHNKAEAMRQQIAGISDLIELQDKKKKKAAQLAAARKAALKQDYQQQIKSLQAKYDDKVALAKQDHQADLQALEAAQQADIKRVNASHSAKVKDVKSKQQAQLARLQATQEADLALLKQKHKQKMASINAKYDHKLSALTSKIERTSELIAQTKKLNNKKTTLAAAREARRAAGQTRARERLAEFRKAIASKDNDSRRAAFTAAINSDNPLLRHTAIMAGLKSDDPLLTTAAMRLGLASDDQAVQDMTLRAALNSGNPATQHLALNEVLSNRKVLTGFIVVATSDNSTKKWPLAIKISYDTKTGQINGSIPAYRNCIESLVGALTGTSLAMAGSRGCTLRVTLSEAGRMSGTFVNNDGNMYKAMLNIAK